MVLQQQRRNHNQVLLLLIVVVSCLTAIQQQQQVLAFVVQQQYISITSFSSAATQQQRHHGRQQNCCWRRYAQQQQDDDDSNNNDNNFLSFLLNPYESKIPKEMENEIYRAEANTVAARERTQRVLTYAIVAIVLIGCAFFNALLTELRHSSPAVDTMTQLQQQQQQNGQDVSLLLLTNIGFGWVTANALFRFVFLNKIGGGLSLILGAVSGMFVEAELDSRRQNAERIWEELQRRRTNERTPKKKEKVVANQETTRRRKKKRKSGKQLKRMEALSEVVALEEEEEPRAAEPVAVETKRASERTTPGKEEVTKEEADGSFMGTLKGWYDKADSMAASQALLLNKKLEDEGILDKITDESGLKVIGKEGAAAKLRQTQTESSESQKITNEATDDDERTATRDSSSETKN